MTHVVESSQVLYYYVYLQVACMTFRGFPLVFQVDTNMMEGGNYLDANHRYTKVLIIGIVMAASYRSGRRATSTRRLEILVAY